MNTPSLSYDSVIKFLEENNIDYRIITSCIPKPSTKYKFASIYKIIPNGIYFLTGNKGDFLTGINDSLIFSDFPIDVGHVGDNIVIQTPNPQLTHYKLSANYKPSLERKIHETAIISDKAIIEKNVFIGPFSIIGEATIQEGTIIRGSTQIYDNVVIGKNTIIDYNCCIGASGMSWVWDEKGNRIVQPQFGGVEIGTNCILGTDITVVRGTLSENTIIKNNTVIAHGTKIGHGAYIGDSVHFANNVSLAGNARIGDKSFLGSGSVVSVGISLPSNCVVGAGAVVTKTFTEQDLVLAGVPAKILKKNIGRHKLSGVPQNHKNKNHV